MFYSMQKIKQLLKEAEIHKVQLKSLFHTVNLQMWYANRLPDIKTTLGERNNNNNKKKLISL